MRVIVVNGIEALLALTDEWEFDRSADSVAPEPVPCECGRGNAESILGDICSCCFRERYYENKQDNEIGF